MTKSEVIEAWLRSKIGCGYIYGATGWVCTQTRIAEQEILYPGKINSDIVSKWIGKECYDCAQLVRRAAEQVGIELKSGATSQWNVTEWADKGTIDSAPSGKLICLFRDENGTKQHVGWQLRNGDVIDARSSQYGVVLNRPYPSWTHWAMLDGLGEEAEGKKVEEKTVLFKAKVVTQKDDLNVRAGKSTADAKVGTIPKGAIVDVIYESPDWIGVQYGNISGYCAAQYLVRVGDEPEEKTKKDAYTTFVDDAGQRITIAGVWRVVS